MSPFYRLGKWGLEKWFVQGRIYLLVHSPCPISGWSNRYVWGTGGLLVKDKGWAKWKWQRMLAYSGLTHLRDFGILIRNPCTEEVLSLMTKADPALVPSNLWTKQLYERVICLVDVGLIFGPKLPSLASCLHCTSFWNKQSFGKSEKCNPVKRADMNALGWPVLTLASRRGPKGKVLGSHFL